VTVNNVPTIGMNLKFMAEEDMRWHRDVKFYERAFAALADTGLGLEFERMDVGKDEQPFDRKALAKAMAAEKTRRIELWTATCEDVTLSTGGILAEIVAYRWPPSRKTLDGLIAWARAVAKIPEGRARTVRGTVYPIDLEYPARRPPVSHDFVRLGTVADFFGSAWLSEKAPELARVAREAKLPAGASRIVDNDLIVLRWVTDPRSPDDLAEACMRQEDWWRAQVDMPLEGGWNAEGDRGEYPAKLEPCPPFTLVDRVRHVGYRAVVVMPDGTLDGASWSEIAQLTALRQLADGTPIEHVRLIVPVRDSALAIAERARELGVDGVLYKEGDTLFNVIPPGNWRVVPLSASGSRKR
jgi:hypothetical protein